MPHEDNATPYGPMSAGLRAALRLQECRQATPLHRSLMMALLVEEVRTGQPEFAVVHPLLMTAARIGNRTNYFRVLRELSEWGVIVYCSTPQGNSRVSLMTGERSTVIGTTLASGSIKSDTALVSGSTKSDTTASTGSTNSGTTRRRGSTRSGTTTGAGSTKNDTASVGNNRLRATPKDFYGRSTKSDTTVLYDHNDDVMNDENNSLSVNASSSKGVQGGNAQPARRTLRRNRLLDPLGAASDVAFPDSDLYDFAEFTAFVTGKHPDVDAQYYFDKVDAWRKNGQRPRRSDWRATVSQFLLNDYQQGTLMLTSCPASVPGKTNGTKQYVSNAAQAYRAGRSLRPSGLVARPEGGKEFGKW